MSVTEAVLRRQIDALPGCRFEVRLIHSITRRAYPGVRLWTATQLVQPATVGFLRIRNREDYDVYFRPYSGDRNAGYILLDLDQPTPGVLARLETQGHEPSVVIETSPGRWQAWIRISAEPLAPVLATRIARRLAQLYAADPASADWRHVGRLAGFTNRKPQRRGPGGLAPWVKLIHAHATLARDGASLLEWAAAETTAGRPLKITPARRSASASLCSSAFGSPEFATWYRDCLHRLRILERYPSPDWSIADKWIARELLRNGTSEETVAAVLRHGSPGFPRRHADPEDYIQRTLRCATR
jgi:hypothetical protein